jgi:hypothetical protein
MESTLHPQLKPKCTWFLNYFFDLAVFRPSVSPHMYSKVSQTTVWLDSLEYSDGFPVQSVELQAISRIYNQSTRFALVGLSVAALWSATNRKVPLEQQAPSELMLIIALKTGEQDQEVRSFGLAD